MKPQSVRIHGVPCLLQNNGGGGTLTNYIVTDQRSGAVLASEASRLLAVAEAAKALREGAPA